MDDLTEYKNDLFDTTSLFSEDNAVFPEESFFEYVKKSLKIGSSILRFFAASQKGVSYLEPYV